MSATDWGMKVSLPGFDVKTATPEQCAFHSGFANPKIETNHTGYILQKTQVLTIGSNPASPSTTNLLTVNHPYNYVPLVMGTWLFDFLGGRGPEYGQMPLFLNVPDAIHLYATSTQIKVDLVRAASATPPNLSGISFTLRYTITVESGA